MTDDQRIQCLLEEAQDSMRTPEEVCREYPALLPKVRERWERLQCVEAQVEALFPSSRPGASRSDRPAINLDAEMPQIPGYKIESVLGHGGMGVVYKAWHLKLNRHVALKMLLAGVYASPLERQRLTREAQAVATLCHSNIVTVHDVGEHNGCPYFTMEFVDGITLAHLLAGTPQSLAQIADLVATLADAIHAAHQAGIVHRDLKPANVLLTANGTPKISDFGLARRVEGEAVPAMSVIRAGTPSYMAPEQALGNEGAFCPAVDIYSLGAVLYEMLTGRPPFRADTAAETERQVINDDPAPPSRFKARIPIDLETICLKCLRKDPQRRYVAASALADDLHRFLRGQPISARPVGRPERIARWIRRNRAMTALIVTAVLLLGLAIGAGVRERTFVLLQRAEMSKWSDRLAFVVKMQEEGRFDEARGILLRVPDAGSEELRNQIEIAKINLALVEQFDAIRLSRGAFIQGGGIDYEQSSRQYEVLFREAELGDFKEDPGAVAKRLGQSPIRKALVAALDDWAVCASREPREWVLDVARRLDPDPWRDRVRDQGKWANTDVLAELAAVANVREQPVNLMVAMGTRWRRLGGDPTALLEKVQRQHPNDFWVNFELGHLHGTRDVEVAIGYCRAALAVRPEASPVRYNLGVYLLNLGHSDEAFDEFARVVQVDPKHIWAYYNLGTIQLNKGRISEAIDYLQKGIALDANDSGLKRALRNALIRQGRWEEAYDDWREFLIGGKATHEDWHGFAELSLFLERKDDYHWACQELLTRFGSATDPQVCERIGRACLFLPNSPQQLQDAVALIDRALAADKSQIPDWTHAYFMVAKALGQYRESQFDSAIESLKGEASSVLGPTPKLLLAMALCRRGQLVEARRTLALAIGGFDWRAANANTVESWIYHLIRREAENLILPNLQAFLEGKYQPTNNDERFALLGVCAFKNLPGRAAQLYTEILNESPEMANDLRAGYRYNAACNAALAGCGRGDDAESLSDEERTKWRDRARQWLHADLAAIAKVVENGHSADREFAQQTLEHWRVDPDLAGIRDSSHIDKLATLERDACTAVWKQVDTLLVSFRQTTPSEK